MNWKTESEQYKIEDERGSGRVSTSEGRGFWSAWVILADNGKRSQACRRTDSKHPTRVEAEAWVEKELGPHKPVSVELWATVASGNYSLSKGTIALRATKPINGRGCPRDFEICPEWSSKIGLDKLGFTPKCKDAKKVKITFEVID